MGALSESSWGTGMHSIMQCLRCLAELMAVSMKITSLRCCVNIFRRHFLKLRISAHALLPIALVADSCCNNKNHRIRVQVEKLLQFFCEEKIIAIQNICNSAPMKAESNFTQNKAQRKIPATEE
jgi:hypothetical protein